MLCLQHNSVWTSHISNVRWSQVASDFHNGQSSPKCCCSQTSFSRVTAKSFIKIKRTSTYLQFLLFKPVPWKSYFIMALVSISLIIGESGHFLTLDELLYSIHVKWLSVICLFFYWGIHLFLIDLWYSKPDIVNMFQFLLYLLIFFIAFLLKQGFQFVSI